MKIFVISLVTSRDRRKSVTDQFEKAQLDFEFFDAIDEGRGLDDCIHGIDDRTYRLNTYRDPLPGEIGCYASHLALWQHAVEIDEPIIVLEDDCYLRPNFTQAVACVRRTIDRYGFIRLQDFDRSLSLKSHKSSPLVAQIDDFSIRYLSNVPLCLLGYAVSPANCARLVESGRLIASPVDKFIQRTWEHGSPVYAMTPASVTESTLANQTTIGKRKTNKKLKVAIALRRARYKLLGEIQRRRFDRKQLAKLM